MTVSDAMCRELSDHAIRVVGTYADPDELYCVFSQAAEKCEAAGFDENALPVYLEKELRDYQRRRWSNVRGLQVTGAQS